MKQKELINKLTLEEKASLLSGSGFWTTHAFAHLDIPALTLADGPHGIRRQGGKEDHLGLHEGTPATCFPTSATLANSWDEELAEYIANFLGKEAVVKGVNVVLGPGLNIKRSPLCGRNFEYFSEDPLLSGKMAAAYIRGIQSNGIAACPKHFAVNNQELLRMTTDCVLDERTMREIYLMGFEIAVKEGKPKSIMSSYNRVNGTYANENDYLLRKILIDEWGFEGFVVTDWGGGNDHVEGIKAGSHLEMPGTDGNSAVEVIKAVQSGQLSMETLNQRVDELLNIILDIRLDNKPQVSNFDIDLHHQVARVAAEKSIVLLKNEGDILPFSSGTNVAVIGDFAEHPRYQGAGSSLVTPTKLDNSLEAIRKSELKMLGYARGFERLGGENEELRNQACELALGADVVLLYLGLDEGLEAEGMDRRHMRINENQIKLLHALNKVNKNIVVVLSGGSAVEMNWEDQCSALLYGCLSGQAGASAVINILTGKVNPSGKLSESIPLHHEDTPAYSYFPGREKTAEYRESLYVGYRYYDTASVPVRFPFGFGLSYTSFTYADLKLSSNKASFTLTNTGNIAGAEVVQLYIGKEDGTIFRPRKELKGFKKVFLEPGESKHVEIALNDQAYRYYNVLSNTFEIEGGEYQVFVGASSMDIRLTGNVKAKGTGAVAPYLADKLPSYYTGKIRNVSDEEFEVLLDGKIPPTKWDQSIEIDRNDSVSQLFYAKGVWGRLIYKVMKRIKLRAEKRGKPNLNILYLFNMPLRVLAKNSGGLVNMAMVDSIVEIMNGHFFRGFGSLITSWFNKRKEGKILVQQLQKNSKG